MRRIGNRLAAPLFALLFAASLAFGVGSAVAEAPAATACPFDGETWVGACSTDEGCTRTCFFYNGGFPVGDCIDSGPLQGCCVCAN